MSQSEKLTSEQALAEAVRHIPIDLASGYPGSPGGGVITHLLEMNIKGLNVHWSVNEKIAVEKGIGVAISGGNALICVKSVGLNTMIDPLSVVNLTPLIGGLVLVVGDDPGAYGSQNDQDSRGLADFLSFPWFEISGPQQAFNLTKMAFEISIAYHMPVFLRITRTIASLKEHVNNATKGIPIKKINLSSLKSRFVPVPSNAVKKTNEHQLRILMFKDKLQQLPVNKYWMYNRPVGLVLCGAAYHKFSQLIQQDDFSNILDLLHLESIFPLPESTIEQFLVGKERILIIEENTPVIAKQLKVIAADNRFTLKWDSLAKPGEISIKDIAEFLSEQLPSLSFEFPDTLLESLKSKSPCNESRYDEVLDILDTVALKQGLNLEYYGDPGCLVSVHDRIHAKYAMGGALPTAQGARIASNLALPVVLMGDSGLFHSGINAICDAAYQKSTMPIILLNNNSAMTTGGQLHPGATGSDMAIDYQNLFIACGVPHYQQISLDSTSSLLEKSVIELLKGSGLRILQIDIPPK